MNLKNTKIPFKRGTFTIIKEKDAVTPSINFIFALILQLKT